VSYIVQLFRYPRLQCLLNLPLKSSSYCCDRKARAECAQSFTLWQQETIEITCHDHSIIACSRHIYMGVVLRVHSVRGERRIQRNANREVATIFHINRFLSTSKQADSQHTVFHSIKCELFYAYTSVHTLNAEKRVIESTNSWRTSPKQGIKKLQRT